MKTSEILGHFQAIRQTGPQTWVARCPSHDDRKPSLSIRLAESRILLHCFAGCATDAILRAAGLTMMDLSLDGDVGRAKKTRVTQLTEAAVRRDAAAVYDYLDERSALLYRVVRRVTNGAKSFTAYRPSGGGWVASLDSARRVLYRLPQLLTADPEAMVFVPEGEKDVDRLVSLDLVATTNPFGAHQWRPEFSAHLANRHVAVLPDNDSPGWEHANQVADSLMGVAGSVRVVELPGLAPKGDVSDYLDQWHTKEDLLALAANAPKRRRAEEADQTPIRLSDLGNARRLVKVHGADLRYCHERRKWLVWNGLQWSADETGEVMRRAKHAVRLIYEDASSEEGSEGRKAIAKHALESEREPRLRAMISLAQSEPGIPIRPGDLDRDPWKLNVLNGTLALRTGQLLPHSREDLMTKRVLVDYQPDALCPRWEAFLRRIFNQDKELIALIRRVVGYSLTGSIIEHVFFVLYGTGANGKTTFLEVLRALLGDYARATPFDTFLRRERSGASNDLARLAGARLVTAQEVESGARLAEALVKQTTGGDILSARFLFQEFFEFAATFKLFLAVNHKPAIRGTDYAMWRRIRLIPFAVTIPDDEQEKDLVEKLKEELPGILIWALRGALEWQRNGLGKSTAVEKATLEYREESDFLSPFLAECCVAKPTARAAAADLYASYQAWAQRNGEQLVSQRAFGLALAEKGFVPGKSSVRYWKGLGLRAESPTRDGREDPDDPPQRPLVEGNRRREAGKPSHHPSNVPGEDTNASPAPDVSGKTADKMGVDSGVRGLS